MAGPSKTVEGQAHRALVLHDQPLLVDLVRLTLNHGLFEVRWAQTLEEAEAILAAWPPHIALVDLDHDGSHGLLQLLGASSTMRQSATPVLGLVRRGDLVTKLDAFERGVDDVLAVPFSPDELLARSIVIARRTLGNLPAIVPTKLGEIELDIMNREVRAGGSVIHLSSLEQSLLFILVARVGEVVTREEILDAVWGEDFVAESKIVDRHIRSLRVMLQSDHRRPRFIETVPGKGYRFIPTFSSASPEEVRPN